MKQGHKFLQLGPAFLEVEFGLSLGQNLKLILVAVILVCARRHDQLRAMLLAAVEPTPSGKSIWKAMTSGA